MYGGDAGKPQIRVIEQLSMGLAVFIIVISQLFGTSLWFSVNSVAPDLARAWGMTPSQLGWLTSAVQLGFISGTLLFAVSALADRFPASRIFAFCSLLGAVFNAGFAFLAHNVYQALIFRFAVGVCLAGVYPLGMKMVISWVGERAGEALGLLVGMLTIGTALPHGIRALSAALQWQEVVLASSLLALIGAALGFKLGDGPFLRAVSSQTGARQWGRVLTAFQIKQFRASAFGYFGHMWELYAFWTIVPILLASISNSTSHAISAREVAGLSFFVIASGFLGCVVGGYFSRIYGSHWVAFCALAVSGSMCAIFPLLKSSSIYLRLLVLVIWGIAVVADSPQFSAISARVCPQDLVGSALAIQNSIGFFITVLAIVLATSAVRYLGVYVTWLLVPGPLLGLFWMTPLFKSVTGTEKSQREKLMLRQEH